MLQRLNEASADINSGLALDPNHHVGVDFITGHIPTYDTYLLNNRRVAVDCLEDYRL